MPLLATGPGSAGRDGGILLPDGLTWARWGVALLMLAGAAWMDLRTRRVPNRYWVPFAGFALAAWLWDLAVRGPSLEHAVAAAIALASCAVLYGIWWLGVLFGGADAKALMVLAWLLPLPLLAPAGLVPVWDLFMNGLLLMLALPLALAATNLARGRWGGFATFTATPMPIKEARRRFVWPHEAVVDGEVRRRALVRLHDDLDAHYDALTAAGVTEVWATPKIPFIIPLVGGLLLAAWQGNLMWRLVQAAFG